VLPPQKKMFWRLGLWFGAGLGGLGWGFVLGILGAGLGLWWSWCRGWAGVCYLVPGVGLVVF
jgi:hypothetical protein